MTNRDPFHNVQMPKIDDPILWTRMDHAASIPIDQLMERLKALKEADYSHVELYIYDDRDTEFCRQQIIGRLKAI